MYSAVYVLLLELSALIYRFCLLCLHNLRRSGSGPGMASHWPDKRNGVWHLSPSNKLRYSFFTASLNES